MNKTSKRLFLFLALIAVILFIIDFFIPNTEAHFHYENFPAFYAVYGFIAFILLVLIAKYVLRPIVYRKEDFYE